MRSLKGFTIIEVLVSAVIISVLIMGAFAVLDVGRSSWFAGDVRSDLRKDIIRAFMAMERELRETRPVSVGAAARINLNYGESSSSIVFQVPQDSNDADTTILDSLGDIEWSGNITYSLSGNNEIIRVGPDGTTRVLARGITNLEFSRSRVPNDLPIDLLIINITAQKASGVGKLAIETGQLILRMRN
ncbi:MAG: prepilin-type N-terminal cleavage/methylation domain-containing protein [Candidatus Omnitrophota bacterium]|jgi:prepilin-type N-terminal cleavage/methylation domain-containing protein